MATKAFGKLGFTSHSPHLVTHRWLWVVSVIPFLLPTLFPPGTFPFCSSNIEGPLARQRLCWHTGESWSSILLGWMSKEPVVSKPAEAAAVRSGRMSSCWLSFQGYLIIYPTQRWFTVLLHPRPSPHPGCSFPLCAITQGLGHLSCFSLGLCINSLLDFEMHSNVKQQGQASPQWGFLPFLLWSEFLNARQCLCKTKKGIKCSVWLDLQHFSPQCCWFSHCHSLFV